MKDLLTAERAIMEVIYLIPRRETYDEALQLMASLSAIRPRIVQREKSIYGDGRTI